jgi:hypothetical protein
VHDALVDTSTFRFTRLCWAAAMFEEIWQVIALSVNKLNALGDDMELSLHRRLQ